MVRIRAWHPVTCDGTGSSPVRTAKALKLRAFFISFIMFYIYIIKSETSGHFYKGFTSNPVARLYEHNAGFTRHSKGKGPWTMVFLQQFESKTEALVQENRIKKLNKLSTDLLIQSDKNMVSEFWRNISVG